MPKPTVPAAAALLLAAAPGAVPAVAQPSARFAQLIVQQRIVVRVQRDAVPKPVVWIEKKGPKCIAADRLAGVLIVQPDAVDLVQDGGERIRARLDDDCPALNFYGGFYLKPNKDGRMCAGRDVIRARSGRMCEIDSFKRLVAKK